jgi:hypothetical protein
MANPVATNIIKSKAVLWYAPYGEVLPDETTVAAGAAWGGNWARVGYTKKPTVLVLEEEQYDIEVQELLNSIDRVAIKQTARFETELAEFTPGYVALLIGGTVATTAAGSGQAGYEDLSVASRFLLPKYVFGLEGTRYNSANVELVWRVFFTRSTLKVGGNIEFSQKSTDYAGIPITINSLDNDTGAAWFRFQRVTAVAT